MSARDKFSRALDSLFRCLGKDAVYIDDLLNEKDITVIPRLPEKFYELGDNHIHIEDPQFQIRVSEVERPVFADLIVRDGITYKINAEPVIDIHKLFWTCECIRADP